MSKDELYTITIDGKPDKGERIPPRSSSKPASYPKTYAGFVAKHGPPPDLSTRAIIKSNPNLQIAELALPRPQKKSFIELAREYANKTYAKTEHVSFMSYWPNYSDMSKSQHNWYFYLRSQLRQSVYLQTDLSYIFVYIYELLNQINVADPDDGYVKLVEIWQHYRKTNRTLDRYVVEWLVDYIDYYGCDEEAAFGLLQNEGLFLLLPTDVLFDHYIKNNWMLPVELITRICDYKFLDSEFCTSGNGILYLENLAALIHKIRTDVNLPAGGSLEISYKRIPFQRALFYNPDNKKLDNYPSYERHKPFRDFVTSIVKEYENQVRACVKYKGRLRYPVKLTVEIVSLCKLYAQSAAAGEQYGKEIEITIDREKLTALIQDSDEVRKRLLEGSFEYGTEPEPASDTQLSPTPAPPAHKSQYSLLPGLSPTQQDILTFLLTHGGSSAMADISAAFPGVFAGVEIDRINDMALEAIGDLLIGFENDVWYIVEDYITDLSD